MADIAIKIQFTRNEDTTFFRLRGTFSFAAIRDKIHELWEGNTSRKLVIEYLDDDGDRVRLIDESSWAEAVRVHVEAMERGKPLHAPLQLFVAKQKPHAKPAERVAASVGPTEPATADRGTEPDTDDEARTGPTPQAEDAQHPWHAFVRGLFGGQQHPHGWWGNARGRGCGGGRGQGWGRGGGCHHWGGGHHAPNNAQPNACGGTGAAAPQPQRGGAHLGFMHVARSAAVGAAVRALDENRFAEAEQMLRASLLVFVDDPLLEYNLACALAKQGKLDEAVAFLTAAVKHGYDDVSHLTADADLDALRDHPQYRVLVSELLSGAPPVAAAAKGTEQPAAPQAAKAAPEAVPDSSVATLTAMFPQLTAAEIRSALEATRGDLLAATDRCLKLAFN